MALDSDNQLWVGTYNGLYIYKESVDRFYSGQDITVPEGKLSQNSVRSIFKDAQGGMWLGTYWGGLNYYHPLCNRFKHIKHIPYVNSLSDNVVSCIVEDRNSNLWIGTSDGGLNVYDSKKNEFKVYPLNQEFVECLSEISNVYISMKDRIKFMWVLMPEV